jgi:hypothetical protein
MRLVALCLVLSACGGGGGMADAGMDAGGISCANTTCAAGQVCCIDCDGRGSCLAPGAVCSGTACSPDAGPDAAGGVACGTATCGANEVCCIGCDGAGTCGPPGTVCTGISCPPDAGTSACAPGTCVVSPERGCEAPSGPTGNGCCECAADGTCANPCRCASPDTRIATADGERTIASLLPGDLVYSADHGALVLVPIAEVHRSPVADHFVMRARLANGRTLLMSPGHPTADGRFFRELNAGDAIDGVAIEAIELAAYEHDATYDIRPASDTGTYVAEGVLVGSTLAP